MSGGIFPGHPFHLNIKCIIFTIIIAGGYWFLPKKNVYILIFLLWSPYIALAWYDYMYDCHDRMHPTIIPFGRYFFLPFKPPDYQNEYKTMSDESKQIFDKIDHITLWTILTIFVGFGIYKNL